MVCCLDTTYNKLTESLTIINYSSNLIEYETMRVSVRMQIQKEIRTPQGLVLSFACCRARQSECVTVQEVMNEK